MIFSIPRSKSYMEHHSYQKYQQISTFSPLKHPPNHKNQLTTKYSIQLNKSKQLITSNSQNQTSPHLKYFQTPKKQIIYNKSRNKSFDKYLNQNKKKVKKQILLRNLNPQQKRLYQQSQQNKKIFTGKKLVDPIHQKFNYYIKTQSKAQIPFVITDFLLQPCKINSKRIQSRPFTSQSFFPSQSELLQDKQKKYNKVRTHSSLAGTQRNNWRPINKDASKSKINQNFMQFSNQFVSMGSKFQSKHFGVQPWDLDPMSQNMDSIKIH